MPVPPPVTVWIFTSCSWCEDLIEPGDTAALCSDGVICLDCASTVDWAASP